jgi:hypothetical protein
MVDWAMRRAMPGEPGTDWGAAAAAAAKREAAMAIRERNERDLRFLIGFSTATFSM